MKTKVDFVEMPLAVFATSFFEDFMELCDVCPSIKKIDLADENYIIRISENGSVEIGYPSDDFCIGS